MLAGDPRIAELVKAATSRGALFSINHPASTCVGCGWEHAVPEGVTGIEITNGRHGEMAAAMEMWDRLLKEGRRIVAVGSSDWHRPPAPFDVASVRVWAEELSTQGDPGRHPRRAGGGDGGRAHAAAAARGPRRRGEGRGGGDAARGGQRSVRMDVTLPAGLLGRARGPGRGRRVVATQPAKTRVRFDARGRRRYLRLHVFAADGSPRAVTNPVFLSPMIARRAGRGAARRGRRRPRHPDPGRPPGRAHQGDGVGAAGLLAPRVAAGHRRRLPLDHGGLRARAPRRAARDLGHARPRDAQGEAAPRRLRGAAARHRVGGQLLDAALPRRRARAAAGAVLAGGGPRRLPALHHRHAVRRAGPRLRHLARDRLPRSCTTGRTWCRGRPRPGTS